MLCAKCQGKQMVLTVGDKTPDSGQVSLLPQVWLGGGNPPWKHWGGGEVSGSVRSMEQSGACCKLHLFGAVWPSRCCPLGLAAQ